MIVRQPFAASRSDLALCVQVPATSSQFRLVAAVLTRTRVKVPPFDVEFRWGDAREVGYAERDGRHYRVLLRSDLEGERLLVTLAHEMRHLEQLASGRYWRLTEEQREADAEGFARREAAAFLAGCEVRR
jgi:hypothetical protein